MNIKEMGLLLKDLRERKGLTLAQLGELSGYSNPYLSQIETGKRKNMPTPELLKKLSAPLGVDYSTLLHKAGYEDLYHGAKIREAVADFSDELDTAALYDRVKVLEQTKDIKDFLELNFKDVLADPIYPYYNGHKLTEQDRNRILNVLKELFPEYKEPKKGD